MPAKKPMTKTDIVAHIAEKFELPKTTSKAILEEIGELAAMKTRTVGEFTIPGIGKLVKAKRKARKGRKSPQSGRLPRSPLAGFTAQGNGTTH